MPLFEDAPTHERWRAECDADDAEKAKLPGPEGAPARFRVAHGHLGEFVLEEVRRAPDDDDGSALAGVAMAFQSNFVNAIVNLVANARCPDVTALTFLKELAHGVRAELDRIRDGNLKNEAFVSIHASGKVSDYDVRDDLPKKGG